MLDAEGHAHGEFGPFLDLEGLVLQSLLAARAREVDSDGVTADRVHGQGLDDANPRVARVGQIFSTTETQRLLVSLQGFVVGI